MKLTFTGIFTIAAILFSGCASTYIYEGISAKESKTYPLVMIANDNIECGNRIFKKGAKFTVSDISNGKYRNESQVGILSDKSIFPEHTLYVTFAEGTGFGVVVYPNGSFVFEGGGITKILAFNPGAKADGTDEVILWGIDPKVICKYNGETPFTSRRN